ncbi:MAG: NADH-quinone oxidoreductase subunit NuoE [Chloroflexota bacterium]
MTLIETETTAKLDEVFSHFKGSKEELIPVLQAAQGQFGYLPVEVMAAIARFLKIPDSTVYGVSTFYAQFKFIPTGRNTVRVCRGTACHVRGSPRILEEVEKQLGIGPGQTTEDMEYSLETIACFGSCALAPVMVVNDKVYGRMTPKKVTEILGGKKQQ